MCVLNAYLKEDDMEQCFHFDGIGSLIIESVHHSRLMDRYTPKLL